AARRHWRMGLVSRFLRRRDGIALSARPAGVRLARGARRADRAGDLRADRPADYAVPAGRCLSRDLVCAALRSVARLFTLLRRPLLRSLHLWLALRAAGHVAVGWACRVVAGVPRLAGDRPAAGLAVLARRREMGPALGPHCRTAACLGGGAGTRRRLSRSPSLHSSQSTAARLRRTVGRIG